MHKEIEKTKDKKSKTMDKSIIQKKENNTGLPDNLKTGIENLSGYSMDDVKVHYNSEKPAQLQAHAYAQGTDIHLGAGQEKHLPHEAWHVVQQKQGRVKPTMQMKGWMDVNDDAELEKEADVMGIRALREGNGGAKFSKLRSASNAFPTDGVVQGKFTFDKNSSLFTDDLGNQYIRFDKNDVAGKRYITLQNTKTKEIVYMDPTTNELANPSQINIGSDEKIIPEEDLKVESQKNSEVEKDELLNGREVTLKSHTNLTGVISGARWDYRNNRNTCTIIWDVDDLPMGVKKHAIYTLGQLNVGDFRAGDGQRQVARTGHFGMLPFTPLTSNQMDMQRQFLDVRDNFSLSQVNEMSESEMDKHFPAFSIDEEIERIKEEETFFDSESEKGIQDEEEIDSDKRGERQLRLSSIYEDFTGRPDMLFPLMKNGGQLSLSEISVTTPHVHSRADFTRGNIATRDTFSGLFLIREGRHFLVTRDGDQSYELVDINRDAQQDYMGFTYKNTDFNRNKTKDDPKDLYGVNLENKKKRNYKSYHAEEQTADSLALEDLSNQLISNLAYLESLEEIENERTRFIIAINRTSCRKCVNVLVDWINTFWAKLKQILSLEVFKYVVENRIVEFEAASPNYYSDSRQQDLKKLVDAGWKLTVLPGYDEKTRSAFFGEGQQFLSNQINDISKPLEELDEGEVSDWTIEDLEEPYQIIRGLEGYNLRTRPEKLDFSQLDPSKKQDYDRVQDMLNKALMYLPLENKKIFNEKAYSVEVTADKQLYEAYNAKGKHEEVKLLKDLIDSFVKSFKKLQKEKQASFGKQNFKPNKGKGYVGGNCLFNAVQEGLGGLTSPYNASDLRQLTGNEIRQNPMAYLPFMPYNGLENSFAAVTAVADELAQDGHWDGDYGDFAPVALANAIGRNIIILNLSGSIHDIVGPPGQDPIFIYYSNGNHYIAGTQME